jgi:FtsP/CotA-like multicopper oxidase with cupredoxin domain
MQRRRSWLFVVTFALLLALLATAAAGASAKVQRMPTSPKAQALAMMNTAHHKVRGVMHHGRVTPSQRAAAAARLRAKLDKAAGKLGVFQVGRALNQGTTPDYWTTPNWNTSPSFIKFTQLLPGIPAATPNTTTFPGSDYYIIGAVDFTTKMGDLPGYTSTNVRGYVQLTQNASTGAYSQMSAPAYLGPLIVAQRGRPVRLKFVNLLGANAAGNLMIPVDTTTMGAGYGPNGTSGGLYPQNRADVHLHGGDTAWISDGTPNQWVTPTTNSGTAWANSSTYQKGVSVTNVPDMMFSPTTHVALGLKGSAGLPANATTDPGPGSSTYFYTNNESARLMFYHDHSFGITRLNVYAGEAAAYLLQDTAETTLTAAGGLPPATDQIPLVIQDKGFVDASTINTLDPTWAALQSSDPQFQNLGLTTGSLWYPHVYMPNQNPADQSGASAFGRWDYGPWFWPIFGTAAGLVHGPVANPFYTGNGTLPDANGQPPLSPGTPNPSMVPEYFADTMLVNGMAYPYQNVQPKAYRLRILNASNERMLNLQLYTAADGGGSVTTTATASASVDASGTVHVTLLTGGAGYTEAPGAWLTPDPADATHSGGGAMLETTITAGAVSGITITSQGSGWLPGTHPQVTIGSSKEVKMVEACPDGTGWNGTPFPATWPTDGRAGGVPDPATAGPAWVQVGTEGGFLPKAADIPAQPVNYVYNRRDIVVLNVSDKSLFMAPAERADVVVDFSKYAGRTVILYNDAPAPVPAFDPRFDLYTGGPDMRDMGGPSSILVGQGPNTRTIMAFKVAGGAPVATTYTRAALDTNLPIAYQASQPAPVVPQMDQGYPAAYAGTNPADIYSRIQDNYLNFIPLGASTAISHYMEPKAIQELFEMNYGRMNATLGVELPFTNSTVQTTIPLGYLDPLTESINGSDLATPVGSANDGSQIWKITHNGVDTHVIHWHLYNVQLINRVGWDGAIRPPDANEVGWKESIRMNPLEDCIVALRPVEPVLPFKIGDSVRPDDPTLPIGATMTVTDPTTGNPATMTNQMTNFGWEYVWHCHLLGHEENDMMRPVQMNFSPPAPTNLTAAAATGPVRVNLSWTSNAVPNPPTTNYLLERATNSTFTANVVDYTVNGAATVTFSDTAVTSGATYYYRVRAENVSAYSGWSNTASVTIAPPPPPGPTPPTNLRVTGFTATTVSLAWTNGTGATGLRMQFSTTSSSGPFSTRVTLVPTATTYTFTGLTSNRRYWFRVQAVNGAGLTANSNVVSATPNP